MENVLYNTGLQYSFDFVSVTALSSVWQCGPLKQVDLFACAHSLPTKVETTNDSHLPGRPGLAFDHLRAAGLGSTRRPHLDGATEGSAGAACCESASLSVSHKITGVVGGGKGDNVFVCALQALLEWVIPDATPTIERLDALAKTPHPRSHIDPGPSSPRIMAPLSFVS